MIRKGFGVIVGRRAAVEGGSVKGRAEWCENCFFFLWIDGSA